MRLARIPHDAVDIWEDDEAVRAVNDRDELVPTVHIAERFLSNPTLREVHAAVR